MKRLSRVSIVIPVYNEAAHLPACLAAIEAQIVRPYEVIVVDNNSTDATLAIARSFDFVTIISEKRQGVVHARNSGFNSARGDIIGRIDADSMIAANWVETVQKIFSDHAIGAVSGRMEYYDMALSPVLNRLDLAVRRYFAWILGDEVALQGANMALRRSVWLDVRGSLCNKGGMHEDFDLAVHANWSAHKVVFDDSLVASIGCRQVESKFGDYLSYVWLSPKTYGLHGLRSRKYMYPIVALAVIGYLPLKMLHRGFDTSSQTFSWKSALMLVSESRVNPATFVD